MTTRVFNTNPQHKSETEDDLSLHMEQRRLELCEERDRQDKLHDELERLVKEWSERADRLDARAQDPAAIGTYKHCASKLEAVLRRTAWLEADAEAGE